MDKDGFTPRLAGIMDPSATSMFLYPITLFLSSITPFRGSLCALHPPMIWAVIGAFM
jgi:hypothetical protein